VRDSNVAEKMVFQVVAFRADMQPEPPVPVRRLVSATANAITFDGIAFVRTGDNSMSVTASIVASDGSTKPIELHYVRTARFARP
jgi:hypothetical protein